MTSAETIIVVLDKISKTYDISLDELMLVAGLKREKKQPSVLQMIMINKNIYYLDDVNNIVYSKKNKKIGMLCPETKELIFT